MFHAAEGGGSDRGGDEPRANYATPRVAAPGAPAEGVGSEVATPDTSLAETWARIRRRLRAELGEEVVASWFASSEVDGEEGGRVVLTVPTRFLKSWIEAHYLERLARHFAAERGSAGVEVRVRGSTARPNLVRAPAEGEAPRVPSPLPRPAEAPRAPRGMDAEEPRARGFEKPRPEIARAEGSEEGFGAALLDRRLTFDSFLVGKPNEFAHAAARKVAAGAAAGQPAQYNPLYLHAAVGLGKTHLAQAVAHEVRAAGRRVAYLTAERFMHGFVAALKAQTAISFKDRLRGYDLLVLDDVQFLQGKSIQAEFGHTLNALLDAGRQVIVLSDRPPSDLETLDDRVRSRLSGGLGVELGALDEELRRRILDARVETARAAHPGFEASAEVLDFVARTVTTNGRDLEGAVNRLVAHATIGGGTLTVETAEAAIRDLVRPKEAKRVKIEEILKVVATHYNVSRADILSARRTASVVRPRQIAMYLSKVMTPRSLPEIGRRFGGRDHTTVLHAVRKIEGVIQQDGVTRDEVDLLKRLVQE